MSLILSHTGVGQLIQMAAEKGRKVRPDIKLGICGEHGGDPASIEFCNKVGLTYVSCSPFRVPIARRRCEVNRIVNEPHDRVTLKGNCFGSSLFF